MIGTISLLFLLITLFVVKVVGEIRNEIESYTFQTFPKDKIALHMPCEESNMFATKCMCHIKCTDNQCLNARKICEKYQDSKGCRYMLIRGYQKKIATLKRVASPTELARFNVSMYPHTFSDLSSPRWKSLKEQSKTVFSTGTKLSDLLSTSGNKGQAILSKIFSV